MRNRIHRYAVGGIGLAAATAVALAASGLLPGKARSEPTRPAATVPATVPAPVPVRRDPVPPPPVGVAKPPATGPTSVPVAVVTPAAVPPLAVPPVAPGAVVPPQPPLDPKALYGWAYSAGLGVHERMTADGRPAGDQADVMRAFLDGLAGKTPAYSREELRAAAAGAESYLRLQKAKRAYADDPGFRREANEAADRGRAILDRTAKEAGVEVRPDAVQVQVVEPAKDPAARAWGNARTVTLDLRVSLADGTLVSATEAGKPVKVDVADLLPAVADACRGMRVGDRVRLMVPGEKAYGLAGKPPVIGPNQALEYELGLVGAE